MKKPILFFLLSALLFFSCDEDDQFTTSCLPANLQNGVIAFYPFNNGALSDVSSGGNDLVNTTAASAAADRNGNANCAFQFDNTQAAEEFLTTTNTNFLNGLSAFPFLCGINPSTPAEPEVIMKCWLAEVQTATAPTGAENGR